MLTIVEKMRDRASRSVLIINYVNLLMLYFQAHILLAAVASHFLYSIVYFHIHGHMNIFINNIRAFFSIGNRIWYVKKRSYF